MNTEMMHFLFETSYTGAYVQVLKTTRVYEDETCEISIQLDTSHHQICEVKYELSQGDRLAIQINDKLYFVYKKEVLLLLFVQFIEESNLIELAYFDSKWNIVNLSDGNQRESPCQKDWALIAQHLKVLDSRHQRAHRLILQKVLGDTIEKRHIIARLVEQRDTLKTRYLKLRQSKLGKIQIKLWERR
ncbi:hypothetical protein [Staphylococcus delphini]|uniref:hypothetical protein n=1 Tax=Staphylococcus delphini TaxID=53344 RepID=UPI00031FDA8E|nr:hypothetical protein [Staphylococcus delphini]